MTMLRNAAIVVAVTVICASMCAGAMEMRDVSRDEAAAWARWTIPLPKRMEIARKAVVDPAEVGIRLRRGATEVERTAAQQLEQMLGAESRVSPLDQAFRIVIGVCDDDGTVWGREAIDPQRLRRLPNSDQAYAIVPLPERNEIVLTALTGEGVYYAAQTLGQLLERTLTNPVVEIPLAEVLDWPDLEERGEWGGSAVRDIEWMSRRKMNLVEAHSEETVAEDGTATATFDVETVLRGRRHATNVVPIITHLDHLLNTGVYNAYPQLVGEGYDLENPSRGLIAPCASKPEFIDVLAGWMDGLASVDGVTDINCWLSEIRGIQCKCPECQAVGQFVLEARSIVKAWRRVQPQHPDVNLRILLTQGSYETNEEVLAEIPPDIGVTYYDGGRTYDSSRDEMIYPLLEKFAAGGRWLGCYPQLTASWRIVCPWTGPQFIHYRMNEFVDDGLKCLCGYATPDNICYEFNVIAAAEWSWNAKGRSPREFAAAYATRRGFDDPDAFAEWAVRMGPVGWDLYGSRVPYSAFFGAAANYVKQRAVPKLGEGMYRYFPTLDRLDEDIATCQWAAEAAAQWDRPELVAEARAIGGMLRMLRTIYDMTTVLSDEKIEAQPARERLNAEMFEMAMASQQAVEALRAWRDALEGWNGASRFDDTVRVIEETAAEIGEFMEQFGIHNPGRAYRMTVVGEWSAEDFAESERRTKTFEVTRMIDGPGTYLVGFRYTTGWNGLHSYSVELLSDDDGELEDATVIAVDEHEGMAAYRPENTLYTLEVGETDPDARYFIRVDIRGRSDEGLPADRQGCNGEIWMRKAGRLDPSSGPPPLEPMTDEQAAAFGPPRFVTDGLHVGVLPVGYGATSIRQWLGAQEGVEVRQLARIAPDVLAPAHVVVIPQPMNPDTIDEEGVAALREFVRAGGGLVVTHDAAGFRGHPPIIPEICAGGVEKVDADRWRPAGDHPIARALPAGEHGQSYYDQIVLEARPRGTIVAESTDAGAPIAVAGEFGRGRYVAIGLAVGIDHDANDLAPTGAEAQLLLAAVRWSGEQSADRQ